MSTRSIEPAGRGAHVDHAQRSATGARYSGNSSAEQVRGAAQERLVERRRRFAGKKRQVADAGLDEVLEEVRAERQVRHVVAAAARDLDQHRGVVDVRVGDAARRA